MHGSTEEHARRLRSPGIAYRNGCRSTDAADGVADTGRPHARDLDRVGRLEAGTWTAGSASSLG
jgi:hypothetical protein